MRPALFRTRRATAVRAFLSALCAGLFLAQPALADVSLIAPQSGGGSPNADHIRTLYLIAFGLGIVIFLLVEGVLVYSLVKFRRRRGGDPPAQIRGNTRLEIGWTIGAASILVVLTVVTFIFLGSIKNPAGSKPGGLVAEQRASGRGGAAGPAGKLEFASLNQAQPPGPANTHLNIQVNGQQYLWRFNYPGADQVFSYVDMYVPINTTVTLDITASDVDHSWWIPKLGGKADAIPGYTNHTWFRISRPGTYTGQCAELCGEGHADMLARVHAVTPDQYKAWLARQAADIRESQALLALERKTRGQGGP